MTEPVSESIDGEGLIQQLVDVSILVESEDDLRLGDEFERSWRRRIEHARDGNRVIQHLAMLLEVDPDAFSIDEREKSIIVQRRGTEAGAWPSEAALIADVALFPIMDEWLPVWEDLDGGGRDELLARLRLFLETCPSCDGELASAKERDLDAGHAVMTLTCEECGQVALRGPDR